MSIYADVMTGSERHFIQSGTIIWAHSFDIIYNANADKFDKYLPLAQEIKKTITLAIKESPAPQASPYRGGEGEGEN